MQLNEWQLIPQPERFTELYFTDYRTLPHALLPGKNQDISFTVHNLEKQATAYRYTLVALSADGNKTQTLSTGALTINQGDTQTVRRTVTIPQIDTRIELKLTLNYEGIAFGKRTPGPETQSLHYWVTAALPGTNESAH